MDAIAGLLDGPRARGAFLVRCVMDGPWNIDVRDEAPLTVMCVVRGSAWITPPDGEPVAVAAGDVALVRGPDPYSVADAPGRVVSAVIRPGGACATPDGRDLTVTGMRGPRTWGTGPDGATVILTGAYTRVGEVGERLLRALPALVVLQAGEWDHPVVPLLDRELDRDEPGQEAVLDRLLDLLVIAALRTWFTGPGATSPGWFRGYADPVVGPALRMMQSDPAHPWTVASLAAATGVSRAALARRFTRVVGEPPLTFLTAYRIALAADLLCEPGATVGSVAHRVGYGTPFALSAAFRRVTGVSPREHRERARAAQ